MAPDTTFYSNLSQVNTPIIENQKKKNCKCKHVALISANWTEEELSRARKLGCKIFTKPFFFQEFDEWLDEVETGIDPTRELCNWFQDKGYLSEK